MSNGARWSPACQKPHDPARKDPPPTTAGILKAPCGYCGMVLRGASYRNTTAPSIPYSAALANGRPAVYYWTSGAPTLIKLTKSSAPSGTSALSTGSLLLREKV